VKPSSDIDLNVVPQSVRSLFTDEHAELLLTIRRDLHRHPELSGQEHRTADTLAAELAKLPAVEVNRVAGTGIVARIPGADSANPTVAVRGDIDALPIDEETGLSWASENPGVMHACGHDVHATWALAAAGLLTAAPAAGDVLVVFQPAEEIGVGAKAILESGALDDIKAMFGGHVDRRFAVGEVVVQAGPLAAASDLFEIELVGCAAHGGRPHEGVDPIVATGALISALQSIVARRINPAWPAVVSIGKVHAGNALNIIPERSLVAGTIRTADQTVRDQVHTEMKRVAEGIAAAHGVEATVQITPGAPPVVNTEKGAAWARLGSAAVLDDENIVPLGYANMASEDFGWYLQRTDGCFMRIGAREDGGEFIPGHAPNFLAADGCIFIGAAVLAESARAASEALSNA
jgi:amidohydrolase